MYLIVGLGNPGQQYIGTRHNLGFSILDELRRKLNLGEWITEEKFRAQIIKTSRCILVRPLTYMNKSGLAVSILTAFFKIHPENVIVVHDELDLQLGKIKIRVGGSAAGHHGVESIIEALGTDKFLRFRVGIGNTQALLGEHKRASFGAEKFVMEPFTETEISKVKHMIKQAIKGLETILENGVEKAQNQFN